MGRYIAGLAVFLISIVSLVAQKPVALKTMSLFQGHQPVSYSPFHPSTEAKSDILFYVNEARSFTLRPDVLTSLIQDDPGLIQISLPAPADLRLDLFRTDIYRNGASIKTSDGRTFTPDPKVHFYRGMIHGNPNSLAIVTVTTDDILILFSDENGNQRIQRTQDGQYILFQDQDIRIPKNIDCKVDEEEFSSLPSDTTSSHRMVSGNCIEIYVECDYKSYLDNGSSVSSTELWVAKLFHEVITLYDNESIPVNLSDVLVYTTPDPYVGMTNTSSILNAFASHIAGLSYDGRLAHLLSTRSLGGGIAFVDVLCSTTNQCAFSSTLTTDILPFPTYSWNVEEVTHEMGHNLGSWHTHKCVWNGNNTQIDDCGNVYATNNGGTPEGQACYNVNAPILPPLNGGTIMSYCHLLSSVGISFSLGFGTQPGNIIRSRYNNANCNTGSCTVPFCTTITDPLPNAINVEVTNDIYWDFIPNAAGYKITVGTSPTNGSIVNNFDVGLALSYNPVNSLPFGTVIYVKIVPYNDLGDATGCVNQSFTTEPNVAPACTVMNVPVNGATGVPADVVIHWPHSVGNQSGYYISIGTTLNGTDIVNHLNVGNNNSYDHPTSYAYATTFYVKINPYWANGENTTCASQNFTTIIPVAGDFCTTAIDLPCGSALAGSTLAALSDTGMPFCGTSVDAPGIWYKFTGNGQNAVIFTCMQYSYDTKLNAYSGSCSNLTCVTGIDDFCAQGSQISFPTTNGTNYFILVQGWNGAQGTYTLSRTCYSGPFYCQSSGYYATLEWIKKVVIGNFTKESGASSYSDFTGDSITLSRGGTYTITLTPQFPQSSRVEYYKIWADLNKDGDFTDSGEELFSAGPTTSEVTGNITIPVTAMTGNTRMRVSMSHTAITSSCGTFNNGEVEDYKLKLKCNLVTSTSDSGNGSLRNVSTCADDGENILFAPGLNGQTINVTAGPITVDGIWKWMPAQGTNIQIKAGAAVSRILSVPVGKSAEIQYLNLVGGTASQGSAIENLGTLILRSCEIHPAVGSSNPPIKNSGTATIFGTTNVKF